MAHEEQGLLHERRFPGESDSYRQARDRLLRAEVELKRQTERIAEQRRGLPDGGVVPEDYIFEEWNSTTGRAGGVRMSALFADGIDTLVIYSFMFRPGDTGPLDVPCPVCTSIIDGIDGVVPHLTQRIGFAVVSKAPVERMGAHARGRGWRNVRLLSSAETTYNRDYLAEAPDQEQFAMATTFVRRGDKIHHFWSSEEWLLPSDPGQNPRHVDFMWPLWAVLDRTRAGRGTAWMPRLTYP